MVTAIINSGISWFLNLMYGKIFVKGEGDRVGSGGNKIVPKLCPSRSNVSKQFQTKPKVS